VVCAFFALTTQHGAIKGKTQIQSVEFYNLDVIISAGYRVKSKQGTQFRIWANKILKDYLLKGYSLNNRMNRIENNVDETVFAMLSKRSKNGLHFQEWIASLMRYSTKYCNKTFYDSKHSTYNIQSSNLKPVTCNLQLTTPP